MSTIKRLRTILIGALTTVSAAQFSACGITDVAQDYWEYYTGDVNESLREPTGYYQHAELKQLPDRLQVPAGLENPPQDPNMKVPDLPPGAEAMPVGEKMDIRAPIAPLRSVVGVHSQWRAGEAIVWFEPNGAHGITTEPEAWYLLGSVLKGMHVLPGKVSPNDYMLTTRSADFNEFGAPYNEADLGSRAIRYRQIYRVRIGRSESGDLGIATSLIGSMTLLASTQKNVEDLLSPIELQRFAMGFSNQIIHVLENRAKAIKEIPAIVNVVLAKDSNKRDCFMVNVPFDITWKVLREMLPKYEWQVESYSLSKGTIKVTIEDDDPDIYHDQGVDSFALEEDDYIIRVGVEGQNCVITFYDRNDKALDGSLVMRMYSGFSQALSRELTQARMAEPDALFL